MKTKHHRHKRHSKKSKRCNRTQRRVRRGGNMFRGSYPSAPVVCLAGDKHVPCTAFSTA